MAGPVPAIHVSANTRDDYPRHHAVNRRKKEYVVGTVYTNTIEGFWSIFKRGIVGSFHKVFAPRATDTVPSHRASARLKARTLAARLRALAERMIRELEDSASVDPDRLAQALELLKMARLAARPRRRRGDAAGGAPHAVEGGAVPVIRDLRASGVDTGQAPEEALEDYVRSRMPPRDEPAPRPRGRRATRNRHHAWMLEKDSPR